MMEAEKTERARNSKKKWTALGIFFALVALGLAGGSYYLEYRKTHISTDDAFVQGSLHMVAPRIPGTVLRVHVRDNQRVKKGDLLVELDPEPYIHQEKESSAALEAQKRRVEEAEAMILAHQKKVILAEETYKRATAQKARLEAALKARDAECRAKRALLEQAELDLTRTKSLIRKGVVSNESYDRAKTAYKTAQSALQAAIALRNEAEAALAAHERRISEARAALEAQKAAMVQLRAQLSTRKAQMERARAAWALARLRLSYTRILAPAAGYITRKSVEVGNQVKAGQPLMAVVPLEGLYVVANYKETQIEHIRPGLPVEIRVDAFPGRVLHGRVESIMAATGATFSLFPPENATGNYVKVVQRVPVKIVLEENPGPLPPLRIGLSVVPTVLVRGDREAGSRKPLPSPSRGHSRRASR